MPERVPGWESRFAAVLKAAESQPFDVREWNCALFVRACAQAITGREFPDRLSGTLEHTVDAVLERIRPSLARRGDVVLVELPHRTLGVCVGREIALVGEFGLFKEPMSRALIAWSV